MKEKLQKFGGAMYTPVSVLTFLGLVVALTSMLRNPVLVGSNLASPDSPWFKFWGVLFQGAWVGFSSMELLFVVGLPIGLVKNEKGKVALASLLIYLIFITMTGSMLSGFGATFGVDYAMDPGGISGLKSIAGVKTLDTGILGAIAIALFAVWLHNRYYTKKLPNFLGTFQGLPFVIVMGFTLLLPICLIVCLIWPHVQSGIGLAQNVILSTGSVGVFMYTFLERFLIPLGLHHFIYQPFIFGNAVVESGITANWLSNLGQFSQSSAPLQTLFPAGIFALNGNTKVFGIIGVAIAFVLTTKPEKRKKALSIILPTAFAAVFTGITEPFEFTFLFVSPQLFLIYCLLGASMATIMGLVGISGDMFGGLINIAAKNWFPMWRYHWPMYLLQIGIGIVFCAIFCGVFYYMIKRFDLKTPGRELETDSIVFHTKKEYQTSHSSSSKTTSFNEYAMRYIQALGGDENIVSVANCATRLRVTVKNSNNIEDDEIFTAIGARGVIRTNDYIQIIIGFDAGNIKTEVESILSDLAE